MNLAPNSPYEPPPSATTSVAAANELIQLYAIDRNMFQGMYSLPKPAGSRDQAIANLGNPKDPSHQHRIPDGSVCLPRTGIRRN
jgi:hypothetical protein